VPGNHAQHILRAGNTAQCHTQPSHLRAVTPVDDGIVIINKATARVNTDGGTEVLVKGTHLVTFERSATINGTEFVNWPGLVRSSLMSIVLGIPLVLRTRLTPQAPPNIGSWSDP